MRTRKNIRRFAWALACIVTATSVPSAGTAIYASEESFSDGVEISEFQENITPEENIAPEENITPEENIAPEENITPEENDTVSVDIPAEDAELFTDQEISAFDDGIELFSDESNAEAHWNVSAEEIHIENPGEKVTLQCKVENPENTAFTYQWYILDKYDRKTIIDGATNREYVIESAEKTATYACTVTDENGRTETAIVWLYIDTGLDVGMGYRSVTAAIGDEINLIVGASIKEGFGTISYEWYKEQALLEGETQDILHISGDQPGGTYYCIVEDEYGNSEKVSFQVHVNTGFYVEETSISQKVKKGQAADFTIAASVNEAYASLSYQWYVEKDSEGYIPEYELLEGECAKTLHIDSAQEQKTYRCFVSDSYGNSEYVYCYLKLDTELKVEKNYIQKYVSLGESLDLTVNASVDEAFGPLYYTWYEGSTAKAEGAKLNTYHLSDISKNCEYQCLIEDTAGNTEYVSFSIFIDSGLKLEEENEEKIYKKVKKGEAASLTVHASIKEGYGDITYTWYGRNSESFYYYEEIEGEMTDTLHITDVQRPGEYYCSVQDVYGNKKNVYFEIQIDTGFKVETSDTEKYVKLGGNTELVVKASASEPLSYSWYHLEENSYKLLEETTETLQLTNVCKREEYVCVVEDSCGNSQRIYFTVRIDTGFKMDYEKMKTISFVKPGENVTLKLWASTQHADGLSYEWYEIGKDGSLLKLNGESDSFTISDIKKSAAYVGYAHDAYDGEEVTFYIEIPDYENAVKLTENEKKRAETYDSLTFKYFKIEAEKEGKYTIFSENDADVEAYLLDAEGNLAAQSKGNAAIEMQKEMKKGEVYYLAVKPEGFSICRVGFKVEEKHTHKWSKWSVTKAATFTKKGVETRKCEGCGKKETREIKCKTIPAPKLVSAKATGSSKITVSWKAVSGVDGYHVYRKMGNGSYTSLKYVTGAEKTSYVDTTAKAGVTYTYTVKAYCKDGDKKIYSFYDKTGKSAVTKAKAPTLVSAKATAYNKITFNWKAVSGVDGYCVYRKSGSGSYKQLAYVSKNKTSYVDNTVKSGVRYTYTVKGYHNVNGNKLLGYFSKTGKSAMTLPKAPALVSAKALGKGKVQVTWKKVSGINGYCVYRKTGKNSWKVIGYTSANATSYTDKTAKKGVTYQYTVRAYQNNNGNKLAGYYPSKNLSVKAK